MLYGLIVVGVGLLTLVALASLADGAPRTRSQAAPAPASGWGFTDPTGFALLGGIQLIDSACRTGFLTFFPFLLIAKGASVASIGFGLSLVFVGGAAGKLVCGLIAERVGILRTVILTELATGALIAAVVLAPLGWAMLLLMPVGVALNGTSSVLYGTVAEFVRDDRQSRSYGLFYTLGSAAGATAPFVFGLLERFRRRADRAHVGGRARRHDRTGRAAARPAYREARARIDARSGPIPATPRHLRSHALTSPKSLRIKPTGYLT